MSSCRSCGAEIIWLTIHPGGRQMPVDAEPAPNGNVIADLAAGAGVVVAAAVLAQMKADTPGEPFYLSHFATCPHAGRWRRDPGRRDSGSLGSSS